MKGVTSSIDLASIAISKLNPDRTLQISAVGDCDGSRLENDG